MCYSQPARQRASVCCNTLAPVYLKTRRIRIVLSSLSLLSWFFFFFFRFDTYILSSLMYLSGFTESQIHLSSKSTLFFGSRVNRRIDGCSPILSALPSDFRCLNCLTGRISCSNWHFSIFSLTEMASLVFLGGFRAKLFKEGFTEALSFFFGTREHYHT